MDSRDFVTQSFLTDLNREHLPVSVCFDRFLDLAHKQGWPIRRSGIQSLLAHFAHPILADLEDPIVLTEFFYDPPIGHLRIPLRGRMFDVHTNVGDFFLKAYQRKVERSVLDQLSGCALVPLVGRFGWLLLERKMTGRPLLARISEDPFHYGMVYAEILNAFHSREVTYNDGLDVQTFFEDEEPRVIDFGFASCRDPFENDYIILLVNLQEKMKTQTDEARFLEGFSKTYCHIARFDRIRIEKENENLNRDALCKRFQFASVVRTPDYLD